MRLEELKKEMLIPDREIMLNHLANIRGADVLLIAITSEQQRHKLWTLRRVPDWVYEDHPDYESEDHLSHRELMRSSLRGRAAFDDQEDTISKMIIQGQLMTFGSSRSTFCTEQDRGAYMKLQHFVENGMELASFADVSVDRLFLTFYEQHASEPLPDLDLDRELDITLKFDRMSRQIRVSTDPIVLEFGAAPTGIRHSFYDPAVKRERFFTITALTRQDIWSKTETDFAKPTPPGSTEEDWEHFKQQYLGGLELACPRGQELAVVEYESEDNIQLALYAEDFLDSTPKPLHEHELSGKLLFSVFGSSRSRPDANGVQRQTTVVGLVDRAYDGSLVVELMSYCLELPEKELKI